MKQFEDKSITIGPWRVHYSPPGREEKQDYWLFFWHTGGCNKRHSFIRPSGEIVVESPREDEGCCKCTLSDDLVTQFLLLK